MAEIDGCARAHKRLQKVIAGLSDVDIRRTAREVDRDVVEWSDRLDGLFRSLQAAVWARSVRTVADGEHPVSLLRFRRWREVEVHLVDLGLGLTPLDWSQELVDRALPQLVAGLTTRVDQ